MTARNLQTSAKNQGLPWTTAKGFDTFLPLSDPIPPSRLLPGLLLPSLSSNSPSNLLRDLQHNRDADLDVELFCHVNGVEKQRDSTRLMLFPIPRILRAINSVMKLEKGDVVLTGTPKGVGSVKAGDVIRAGIRVGGKEVMEGRVEVEVRDTEEGEGEDWEGR